MINVPVQSRSAAPAATNPADPWRVLRGEMDRLFDRFTAGFGFAPMPRLFDAEPPMRSAGVSGALLPAVDVSESDTAYTVSAELPGLEEKDVEVTLTGDTLVIKGEKRSQTEEKTANYHLSERSYGTFQRAFTLPDGVDRNNVTAEFAKGVLKLTLPKTPAAKAEQRKIEVKPG